MNITKRQLQYIIQEELKRVLYEQTSGLYPGPGPDVNPLPPPDDKWRKKRSIDPWAAPGLPLPTLPPRRDEDPGFDRFDPGRREPMPYEPDGSGWGPGIDPAEGKKGRRIATPEWPPAWPMPWDLAPTAPYDPAADPSLPWNEPEPYKPRGPGRPAEPEPYYELPARRNPLPGPTGLLETIIQEEIRRMLK